MSTMRISELAERSGVPASTLRFYETMGLVPAGRTDAGYRVYGEGTLERLAFIGTAKQLGLPLDEIAEVLAMWASGACADVKSDLRPRLAQRLGEAGRRAVELSAFLARLNAVLEQLDALPDRQERCGPECGFPDRQSAAFGGEPTTPSPRDAPADERWRGAEVACSLSGEDLGDRAQQWRRALAAARREEITDGVRLTLPAERTATVADLAVAEQQCCPFFDFRFHLDGPVLRLEVRAPPHGAGLLADLFGQPA